jgi:hypothetical protein
LNEDPQFTYASRDLDALEQRMKQYAAVSRNAQTRATAELLKQLSSTKDPMQRYSQYGMLSGQLMTQGRWKTLVAVSRAFAADPPQLPAAYASTIKPEEQAQMNIVKGYEQLHDDDGVLREGEKFMAKYPASMMTQIIRMEMNNAINHKHAVEDGRREAPIEIAKLPPNERNNPCKRAPIYNDKAQLADAKREYLACDKAGGMGPYAPPGTMAIILARLALDTRDAPLMKAMIARLEKENPTQYRMFGQMWESMVSDE